MKLREMRAAHPHLFHPNQTWFDGEAFMEKRGNDLDELPSGALTDAVVSRHRAVASAATLVRLYLAQPDAPIWSRYLWTSDTDRHGQQVYIGVNDGRLEIHRHIHITDRFGVPAWT